MVLVCQELQLYNVQEYKINFNKFEKYQLGSIICLYIMLNYSLWSCLVFQ